MDKLFGTDGIRGEAGKFPLDRQTVEVIGRSLAEQMRAQLGRAPRFIAGRDTRESGHWIESAFHQGAVSAGASCDSAGVITTPGVAYLTQVFEFDAGIVISASHNPFQDNGIKIFSPSGKKLDEATERRIEADIRESEGGDPNTDVLELNRASEGKFRTAYLEHLAEAFSSVSMPGAKMVMDCANGAASSLAPELFSKFVGELVTINFEPDGRNINRDCGSLHLDQLQERVVAEGADIGVAFDGDADRSLFVDEFGNLVDGDAVLYAMGLHLKAHGKLNNNKVVATVMSNLGLETALAEQGVDLLRTSVGDKYVLAELLETGSSIGGEQSGHIIFPDHSLVGDGMRTALFLLETMFETGKSLSGITAGFKRFPQTLVNVRVGQKRPFDEVEAIAVAARELEDQLGNKGRLLLRYSGTENLARVMIEGEDQSTIERQAKDLAEVIAKNLA